MLPEIDRYVNIHAHRKALFPQEWVLTNVMAKDYPPEMEGDDIFSVGLHPWDIEGADVGQLLKKVQLATENIRVMAIGEIGLDKAINTPLEIQRQVFELQVQLAEKADLAVILHAVKSYNELIDFMKVYRPATPMIIHGFMGGLKMAEELVKAGFYLSLGVQLEKSDKLREAAQSVPLNRLFLESDEAEVDIRTLYRTLAELRDTPVEVIKIKLSENALRVFHRPTEF